MTELRIYVASLSDYNAGILHGAWIDCEGKDAADLMEEVQAMLRASPTAHREGLRAEEFAIHDHEGFGNLIKEFTSLLTIAELVEVHDELGDDQWKVYLGWVEDLGDVRDADDFRDAYQGIYRSLGDWAYELHQDCGSEILKEYENYIDWDAMGRDAEINGDIFSVDVAGGRVAVFWNR